MKKVYFLLNKMTDYDFAEYVKKYLSEYEIVIGVELPDNNESYDLVVVWNYQKIIPKEKIGDNYVVFHSSDLPKGKGWAPIYYSLANNEKYYTITGIRVAEQVDSGDIIVKARFQIRDEYIAKYLRIWDDEISVLLIDKILKKFPKGKIEGEKQEGQSTYYARRFPKDNKITPDSRLGDIIPHLRACEREHPAFFYFNNVKYNIYIEPEIDVLSPPCDLEIKFFSN